MKLKKTALSIAALSAGAALALAAPLAASAHVSVTPESTAAGSYTVLTFAFSHGCEASPTTSVAIQIPEGVTSVAPTVNPNWDITVATDPADTSEHPAVSLVTYTAKTPLESGLRDTLAVSLKLPDDAAGETLAFPVLQSCVEGQTDWSELAEGDAEPDNPAPTIVVSEAVAGDAHGGDHAAAEGAETDGEHGEATASNEAGPDVLARVFGLGGLALGAVGLVFGIAAFRKKAL